MADFNSVVITPEEVKAPEGHDEKMIALVDGTTPPEDDQKVDNTNTLALPEGFTSVEELAKAYAELQAKNAPQNTEGKPEVKPEEQTTEQAKDALQSKGLDFAEFSQEFNSNGALSQESYDKLAAAGFDKNLVDAYVAGQQALASQYDTAVVSEVGGTEKYSEIVTWAKANLSDQEINAYNAAVSSGNVAQAKLAVAGLNARFSKAVGSEPTLQQGRKVSASEDVFESRAQMVEAMKDKRYRTDPAYRAKVESKLSRSNIF